MASWKTYLVMYFGSDGGLVSDIVKKVESLGFKAALGPADFVFDWESKKPNKKDVFDLADKLTIALKGSNVMFNLDTHD